MKIEVNRIPEHGLSERTSLDPSTLDMERDDLRFHEPLEINAFVTKVDDEIVVKAEIRYRLHLSCGRCLEEFTVPATTQAFLHYEAQASDVVDITEDLRQEVMLSYPLIPVCRPSCKGLCTVCGKNLNASACSHHANQGVDDGATET